MRIYFCDLCNESVPQGDLDRGVAVIRRGRVICARCEHAMSHEGEPEPTTPGAPGLGAGAGLALASPAPPGAPAPPAVESGTAAGALPPPAVATLPPPPRPRGRGGAGLALGLATLALLGAIAAGAFLVQRTDEERIALRDLREDLARSQRSGLQELAQRGDDRLAPVEDELRGLRTDLEKLSVRVDEATRHQEGAVGELRGSLAKLDDRLRAAEGTAGTLDRHEREIAKVADTVAGLHGEVLRLADRIAAAPPARGSGAAVPVPSPEPAAQEKPAWWPIVGQLASENSGARWQAVQALGDTHDPAVAEHLTPMLKDPDIFVRMATARILGDLKAVAGVPALIDALEDEEPSVREAGYVSLRAITGQDLRFDPDAKEGERQKEVRAWRDWWKKAQPAGSR